MSKIFDINPDTLGNLCKKYGIAKDNRRKFELDENYFSIVDTPEKAYWLGFLAADGSISEDRGRIDVTLQPDDESHLTKFLKAVGSTKEIKTCYTNGGYPGRYVHLNSRKMVNDLLKLGLHQNKSLDLLPPTDEQVPNNLVKYWILGYFDGDGGITFNETTGRYKSYFTGTYEVLEFINNYFGYDNTIRQEHNCLNNTYKVEYTEGKTDTMLSSLYDTYSESFSLDRKRTRFINAFNARLMK